MDRTRIRRHRLLHTKVGIMIYPVKTAVYSVQGTIYYVMQNTLYQSLSRGMEKKHIITFRGHAAIRISV